MLVRILDGGIRIEEQKSVVAAATAAVDPKLTFVPPQDVERRSLRPVAALADSPADGGLDFRAGHLHIA
jgi:hypothetical protein